MVRVRRRRGLKLYSLLPELMIAGRQVLIPLMCAGMALKIPEVFAKRLDGYEIALTFWACNDGL
jgi:hypothetical protein